jgi:nucleoside-diphosphate-sugar epimerase
LKGRVLVTGISGFTGPYVRAALEGRGYEVFGLSDRLQPGSQDEAVNLLDTGAMDSYVARKPFDYLIHLAGVSFVAHERAADQYQINLIGTLNLLEAMWRARLPVKKVVLASSANVYGRPESSPVSESATPVPLSDYGVSKYAMELMARMWFDRMPILIVRPFNYTGIGQSPNFVVPKLVKHFRDRTPHISLGPTTVVREFMDVRDVAQIYAALLESPAASQAVNLCSGKGYRLQGVIDSLREISHHPLEIRFNEALVRGNEIDHLVGAPGKLAELAGPPSFRPLEDTLAWMLKG